jgi:hypothetical protein
LLWYNTPVNKSTIFVGVALIAKKRTVGGYSWLLVKTNKESDWEFPKSIAHKGESSVRAVIRMTQEQFFMNATVLEEAGRFTGKASPEEKAYDKMTLYYLFIQKSGGSDISGFAEYKWVEEGQVGKKLESKKEKEVFMVAKKMLKEKLTRKRQTP